MIFDKLFFMKSLHSVAEVSQNGREEVLPRFHTRLRGRWIISVLLLASSACLLAVESKLTFFARLPANNNDVATIQREVENPALSLELFHGQGGKSSASTKGAMTVKCTPFTDNSKPKEWINLKLEINGLAEHQDEWIVGKMLETYINSRLLGMTARLSAERAFFKYRMDERDLAERLQSASNSDLKKIGRILTLPPELLIKSDALEHVFGKKQHGGTDYLLPDGDLVIFVRVHPESIIGTCLPVDRRLLTHPLIRSEFEKLLPQIEARSSKIADDLGIRPQDKFTISAELKLWWRSMRELFAERGWNLIPVDACPDYQMRFSE